MVVPHAGTWIEIFLIGGGCLTLESFPTRERGLKSLSSNIALLSCIVVPHAGTWIEIMWSDIYKDVFKVVPHAGTWIEISSRVYQDLSKMVVPHAGTWIEIFGWSLLSVCRRVVPHAGTWIEIIISTNIIERMIASFPTRERGLKYRESSYSPLN